jgi:hypothetical protein
VKNFAAILLMLSLLLPASGWAGWIRVLPQATCGVEACELAVSAGKMAEHLCPCCPAAACACAEAPSQDLPQAPLPVMPQGKVHAGDLVFALAETASLRPFQLQQPMASGLTAAPCPLEKAAALVPFYISYCSYLW